MLLVDTSLWIEVFRKPSRFDLRAVVVYCLIAVCAIRHGHTILHHDRDFSALAKISPLQERAPLRGSKV